ncbi:hypothetical protein OE88DRAFT_1651673 [Heliocybe sulcata]|uniref:CDC14-domain-containing protein n=1 Tax=Heliocybe sulcata TaxID=5364 RepID=A0A5C3NEH9_9AGAM|nr:hypothetical protein OE88DRAFT_1651673 [Heliocybe sulcata]
MDCSLGAMRSVLQNALDDLISSRTSRERKDKSLAEIERLLASISLSGAAEVLDAFLALQDAFECNIATRVLGWISHNTYALHTYIADRTEDKSNTLMSQLTQALGILQGVALVHKPSKLYLGRKYSLEVLVDLLSTTRRVTTPLTSPERPKSVCSVTSTSSDTPTMPTTPHALLQWTIFETLCCILVDAPPALRHFEEVDGLIVVSKLLRRTSTPKPVRMKIIEFVWIYLMDETTPATFVVGHEPRAASEPSRSLSPQVMIPTTPSTPTRPRHKKARSIAQSPLSRSERDPFLSASGYSSAGSLSDAESVDSAVGPKTPDDDVPIHRPLAMLRKEAALLAPPSHKKERMARLGVASTPSSRGPSPELRLSVPVTPVKAGGLSYLSDSPGFSSPMSVCSPVRRDRPSTPGEHVRTRSVEEKTQMFERMLGKDAQGWVDGVRQQGIWGLA